MPANVKGTRKKQWDGGGGRAKNTESDMSLLRTEKKKRNKIFKLFRSTFYLKQVVFLNQVI